MSARSSLSSAGAQAGRTGPQRLNTGEVARRSARVGAVRRLLLAGTAVTLVGFAGAVIWSLSRPAAGIPQAQVDSGSLVISDPRFVGRSAEGQRVVITAERAVRRVGDNDGPVTLQQLRLEADDGTSATGATGIWTPGAQTLTLEGDVVFTLGNGDVARAARALWEPGSTESAGRLISLDGGVRIQRPTGDVITSTAARWSQGGEILDLTGGATVARPAGDQASATTARWDNRRQILSLSGAARFEAGGTQATSSSATVFYNRQLVVGVGAARITGGVGTVTAERYEYSLASRRLLLVGRVRGTLDP
jgi:hypothetical protein